MNDDKLMQEFLESMNENKKNENVVPYSRASTNLNVGLSNPNLNIKNSMSVNIDSNNSIKNQQKVEETIVKDEKSQQISTDINNVNKSTNVSDEINSNNANVNINSSINDFSSSNTEEIQNINNNISPNFVSQSNSFNNNDSLKNDTNKVKVSSDLKIVLLITLILLIIVLFFIPKLSIIIGEFFANR